MDESADLGRKLRAAAASSGARLTRALSPHGVTAAEYMLLRALYEAGVVAPSVLAQRLGIGRGAVTRLVDRLRRKRLLVRAAAGRDDRRYQTVALTGVGASLVPTLARLAERTERETFAALPPDVRAALASALGRITGEPVVGP